MFLTTISVKNETWVCNTNKDYEIRVLEDFFTQNTKKWACYETLLEKKVCKITFDPNSLEYVCLRINFCPS